MRHVSMKMGCHGWIGPGRLILLCGLLPLALATACPGFSSRKVYVIPAHDVPRGGAYLATISDQGMLLVFSQSVHVGGGPPTALYEGSLYDPKSRKAVSQLASAEHLERDDTWKFRPAMWRFQSGGHRLVGLIPPWLLLYDAAEPESSEIRRVLPSKQYRHPAWSDIPDYNNVADPPYARMAVSPKDGSVALVFNMAPTVLYIYDSDLKKQESRRQLPRPVQDLAWSPDGERLAVLYNGRWASARKRISFTGPRTSAEPDIWIFDAHSGKAVENFRSGSNQSELAFSKDGTSIYTINDVYYDGRRISKGAIRIFSVTTGKLLRTLTAGPKGVHTNFVLSPDGRFIAADASTHVPQGLHLEPIWGAKIARVVVFDAQTGKQVFQYNEKTDTRISDPLTFGFSPHGRFLYVDFPLSEATPYEHIDVFSLDHDR